MHAAVTQIEDLLPAELVAQLHDDNNLVLPTSEWPDPLPRPCLMISPSDERQLRHALVKCGLASLIPEEEVAVGADFRKLIAGLFTVPHKPESDRLIIDRRPQNATEARLRWATLPHGSLLGQIRLEPHEDIRGSGDDVSNYFYLLRRHTSGRNRNAFGRVFTGAEAAELGGDKNRRYHMCLNTLAMGDLNSVDIAQTVHEQLLQKHGCLSDKHALRFGQPVPRSKVLEGVYVDDHVVIGIVPKEKVADITGPDADILTASRAGYAKAGWPLSSSKSFDFSKEFIVWGTEVRSDAGKVGAPRSRRLQLFMLTLLVLTAPGVTKALMQSLLGSYIHPFSHRKECMSVFGKAFKWTSNLPDCIVHSIPFDVKLELIGAALLVLLAVSDIRAPVSCDITTSDATPTRAGVTVARVSQACASALYDHSEQKGTYTRLNWDDSHWELTPWSHAELPSVLKEAVACAEWQVDRSFEFTAIDHVNIQEARAARAALKAQCKRSLAPAVLVNGTDSRVCLGAFAKGRSSAHRLNAVLRSCMGWIILGNKRLVQFWLASADNPSDDPSRDKPLRRPCLPSKLVARLVLPQRTPPRTCVGRWLNKLCLEVFSGCGRLSKALKNVNLGVGEPWEAYPKKGVYLDHFDLLNKNNVKRLYREILEGAYFYIHFGMPCSSFSVLQNLNGGTRSLACPEGDSSLDREVIGNLLADSVAKLCAALAKVGGFYSIENPLSSYLWGYGPIAKLRRSSFDVDFHQCAYGLSPPMLCVVLRT